MKTAGVGVSKKFRCDKENRRLADNKVSSVKRQTLGWSDFMVYKTIFEKIKLNVLL